MILVVEDHPDILRAIVLLLKRDGYEAIGVSSAAQALDYLRLLIPRCIILDYNMPGMDGLQLLETIRADSRYAKVHVIVFSARADIEQRALALGASAFVRKDTLDWAKMQPLLRQFCQPTQSPAVNPPAESRRDVG